VGRKLGYRTVNATGIWASLTDRAQAQRLLTAVLIAALAAACALALVPRAQAQATAGDVFTVTGVKVDARAGNAEDARFQARNEGRAEAFQVLLRRLVPASEWSRLPQPSGRDLLPFESGFEVADERASGTRYLATMTYVFLSDPVRNLLREQGIPFSESQARPVVVLPVLEGQNGARLWRDNPWFEAWANTNLTHELTPVESPLGDLEDISAIDADTAKRASWGQVAPIASRYGASGVMVAYADRRSDGNQMTVYASAAVLTPDGISWQGEASSSGPAGEPGRIYERVIRKLMTGYAEPWKQRTMIAFGQEQKMEATVRVRSFEEWMRVRSGLSKVPTILSVQTAALSQRGAEVVLTFVGEPRQLALNLEQQGLSLSPVQGYWQVAVGGSGAPADQLAWQDPLPPLSQGILRPGGALAAAPVSGPAPASDDDLGGLLLSDEEIERRRREALEQTGEQGGTPNSQTPSSQAPSSQTPSPQPTDDPGMRPIPNPQ